MGSDFAKVKFRQAVSVKATLKVMQSPKGFYVADLKQTLSVRRLFNVNRRMIGTGWIGAVNPTRNGVFAHVAVDCLENASNLATGISELFNGHGLVLFHNGDKLHGTETGRKDFFGFFLSVVEMPGFTGRNEG